MLAPFITTTRKGTPSRHQPMALTRLGRAWRRQDRQEPSRRRERPGCAAGRGELERGVGGKQEIDDTESSDQHRQGDSGLRGC